jgi:hypothetical protein
MSDRKDSAQQSPQLNNTKHHRSPARAPYIAAAFDGLIGKWEFDRWIIDYKNGGADKRFRGSAEFTPIPNDGTERAEYMYHEDKPQKMVGYVQALNHDTIWRRTDDPSKPIELFCVKDGKATGNAAYETLNFKEHKIEDKITWGSLSANADFESITWGRYSGLYKFEFRMLSPKNGSGDRTVVLNKFVSVLESANSSDDFQIMTHYECPADEA